MDLEINNLHQDLIKLINSYNILPIGIIYFILKDCLNEVNKAYNESLTQNFKNDIEKQEEKT